MIKEKTSHKQLVHSTSIIGGSQVLGDESHFDYITQVIRDYINL